MLAPGQLRVLGIGGETEGSSNRAGGRCLRPLRLSADASYLVRLPQAPQHRRRCPAPAEPGTLEEGPALGPSGREARGGAGGQTAEVKGRLPFTSEPPVAEKYLAKGLWVLRGWDARPIDGVHPPGRRKCLQELGGGKRQSGH